MRASPYESLRLVSSEINRLAQAGDWEAAARLGNQLLLISLPTAKPNERAAIESALQDIESITERAEALRKDISRMLAAFEKSAPPK